jgi:hypothetical protein
MQQLQLAGSNLLQLKARPAMTCGYVTQLLMMR